jgi:hypothetical protein
MKVLEEICSIAEADLCRETGIDQQRIARIAGTVVCLLMKNLSGPVEIFGCLALAGRIMVTMLRSHGLDKADVAEAIERGLETVEGATPIVVTDDAGCEKS